MIRWQERSRYPDAGRAGAGRAAELLRVLARRGPLTVPEIRRASALPGPVIHDAVQGLLERGLLDFSEESAGRPVRSLTLTEEGLRVLGAVMFSIR